MKIPLLQTTLLKARALAICLLTITVMPLHGQTADLSLASEGGAIFKAPEPYMLLVPQGSVVITSFGVVPEGMSASLYYSMVTPWPEVYRLTQLRASMFLFSDRHWGLELGYGLFDEEGVPVIHTGSPFFSLYRSSLTSGLLYRIRMIKTSQSLGLLYLQTGVEWNAAKLDLIGHKPAVNTPSSPGYEFSLSNSIPVDVSYYAGLSFVIRESSFTNYLMGFKYGQPVAYVSPAVALRAPYFEVQMAVSTPLK